MKPSSGQEMHGQSSPERVYWLGRVQGLRILSQAPVETLITIDNQLWRPRHEDTLTHRNGSRRTHA